MEISILHEDGSEDELELTMCCESCAYTIYNWTAKQFTAIYNMLDQQIKPLNVPPSVIDSKTLSLFLKETIPS